MAWGSLARARSASTKSNKIDRGEMAVLDANVIASHAFRSNFLQTNMLFLRSLPSRWLWPRDIHERSSEVAATEAWHASSLSI